MISDDTYRAQERAKGTTDQGELARMLEHPNEHVRAAAIRNPATPIDAIATFTASGPHGYRVRSALALSPAVPQAARRRILNSETTIARAARGRGGWHPEFETRWSQFDWAGMFWGDVMAELGELARRTRSPLVLAELAKSYDSSIVRDVARNHCASAETRALLRHWSTPWETRLIARHPFRSRGTESTARDFDRAHAVRDAIRAMRTGHAGDPTTSAGGS